MTRKSSIGFIKKGIRPYEAKGAQQPRLIFPLLSLMVFIGGGLAGGGIMVIRGIAALGVDLNRPVTLSGFLVSIPVFIFALLAVFTRRYCYGWFLPRSFSRASRFWRYAAWACILPSMCGW